MIGKVPKAGRGFKGVVSYLLKGEKGRKNDPSRVAWTDVRNLSADDPELAPGLMRATASRNRRCNAPVYHFVISWHHDEHPTDLIMQQVADNTCRDLDLDEHQRLYVAHADTRHKHLHIVVNRIHPETHKAWNRRQDWVRIERSLADQARDYGFDYVPGRHNEPDFEGERSNERDGAFQRSKRLGLEPLPAWSGERVRDERGDLAKVFAQARSWEELDAAVAERGMMLVRKGQGLVLADPEGTVKVSSLAKGFGLKRLEAQFGEGRSAYLSRREAEPPSERHQALNDLMEAADGLDFAVALHRMGLVGKRELERHLRERDHLQEQYEGTLSFKEKIARDVARAMSGPRPFEKKKKPKARRREDDREF